MRLPAAHKIVKGPQRDQGVLIFEFLPAHLLKLCCLSRNITQTKGHTNGLPERVLKTELSQYTRRRATDGAYADNLDPDVLVVGAGLSRTYLVYEMRKQGYKTVLYDAGFGYGGTW